MHKPVNKKQSLDYIENAERQQLILLITDYWKLFKIQQIKLIKSLGQ